MTSTQAVRSVLSKYATFSGRAPRSEYWWFYLFSILVSLATSVVDAVLNTVFNNQIQIVGTISNLALLLPTLAVTARRLHDTSRSGWWILFPVVSLLGTIVVAFATVFAVVFGAGTDDTPAVALSVLLVACGLITIAAFITLLVFMCLGSNAGPNKYGPSPTQQPMVPTGPGGYYPPTGYGPQYGYPAAASGAGLLPAAALTPDALRRYLQVEGRTRPRAASQLSGRGPGRARGWPESARHPPTERGGEPVMRVVISDFISLDGVAQAPGGPKEDTDGGFAHGGWSMPFFDPDSMGAAIGEAISTTTALLFGRRTWQGMAAAWPARAGDPFADHMNSVQKYVVSGSLTQDDLRWNNSRLLPPGDVVGAVRKLRAEAGGDLQVLGSLTLARTLISNDLVDEYRLMVEPILLGGGKRLFPDDGQDRALELVSSQTSKTGVLVSTYRPLRSAG
ncbi:MAG: DUF805 domain-containing protein [Nocardioidaceae bacterium]